MRQIPSLQTLCLRSVGGKSCSAEDAFARSPNGGPSASSRLLRSYQKRVANNNNNNNNNNNHGGNGDETAQESASVESVELTRIPVIGKGSARRKQANDVDLHHPWIGVLPPTDANEADGVLWAEHNTPGLDLLQSYIDSLVELSRMDDGRLGLHFFQEWRANVLAKQTSPSSPTEGTQRPTKKRRKSQSPTPGSKPGGASTPAPPLGSLSLHNAIIQEETIAAMVESKATQNLAVLDWTGIQTLTDSMLEKVVSEAPNLLRLSVKNCRRLTNASLEVLSEKVPKLTALDVGGSYNLDPQRVVELVAALPKLEELHVSGLPWTDDLLFDLSSLRSWKALSWGYLLPGLVSPAGLRAALTSGSQSKSLASLALPFCEHLVDAALLGVLGRHLPALQALDVRGNPALSSLTGWYDGRATISPSQPPPSPLFVLGRYSGLSKAGIEDTRRIHPLQAAGLSCSLDSGGVGEGIQRRAPSPPPPKEESPGEPSLPQQ